MQTEALIKELAANAHPVKDGIINRRLATVFSIGLVVALSIQMYTVGARSDVSSAATAVLLKVLFCLTMGVLWARYLRSESTPGNVNNTHALVAVGGLALVSTIAAFSTMDFGALKGCVSQVLILSTPALLGFLWVLRKAAPLHATRTGFAIGMAAGAIGAFGYSFGCLTDEPTIVAFRYGTAMIVSGLIGAFLGRLFLKW